MERVSRCDGRARRSWVRCSHVWIVESSSVLGVLVVTGFRLVVVDEE